MPYHIDEENSELAFEVREGNKLVIKIKSNIFSDSLELYLIKVGDNTEPTDKNVFSSLRVLKEIENLHDTILKEINSVTSGFWELKQDSQGNEYIATKYNVLTEGGLTTYGLGEQKLGTIYDGLPIDNDTIYWEEVEGSRVLKAKGSGGGEAGSVQWGNITGKPTWIGDNKPTYNWSEIQGEKPFYTKDESDGKYVTIDTEQEISGLKHFTAGLSVGESKKKIYEENGVVYIDADVAVTGGMTFYATAGRSVSTIMDAVTVDGITIKKENNVLKAVSGAGSSFDENAMWSALSGSSDNQINKSHLTNALAGYATESWVTGKGYATESWVASKNYATTEALNAVSNKLNDFLEGSDADTIINKWKELEAFLSGMAETDNLAEILETKADKKYVDSTFVTLATKQTITGEKTFTSVLNTAAIKASGAITTPSLAASDYVTIAGIKLRKLEDGALMLEGNLALTGALTMYASNGQSFDTIYDGLPIDNDTIYWQEVEGSKVLKARGGSGSSFNKSAMWTALAGSTTEQINKSHLTTALTGYATESWVTSKNYLTSVSIATISDLHANWDALLKAAPSSYVTRWPTISEVTGRENLIIKLNGGSTEGTNQFTYNATGAKTINITPAGIGAAASSHNHSWSNITSGKPTTLAGYGITDGVNSVSVTGTGNAITSASISGHSLTLTKGNTFVLLKERNINTTNKGLWDIDKTNGGANCWNNPANAALQLQNNNNALAIIIDGNENGRMANIQVGHENTNYAANVGVLYLNRLGGDVYIGTTLAATINSNVASATKLQNTRYLWGVAFDGTKNIEGTLTIYSDNTFDVGTDACNFNNIYARVVRNTKARDMVITQDASAGLILRTSATNRIYITSNGYVGINKNDPSFTLDVSGYIRADLAHLGAIETNTYGTGKWTDTNMLSNATIKSVAYGAVDESSAHCHIGWEDVIRGVGYSTYYAIGSVRENSNWGSLYFAVGNNDTGTSAGCKLYLRGYGQAELIGNLLVTGGTTFYESDQRAKNIIGLVYLSLMQISKAPTIRFRWNGWHTKDDGRNHVGGIAQYIQGILPEAIINSDKSLSMDYATVAYTFAVHTARHLLTYETRTDKKIKKLEREIVILKKQLKKLGYEEVRTLDDQSV